MLNTAQDVNKQVLLMKERALLEPEWFVKTVLRQNECDPWHLQGVEALADVHRLQRGIPTVVNHEGLGRVSVVSCHGTGKTHWLGIIAHWWMFCFYSLVVCTAPKENQLKTRLFPRFRKINRGAEDWYSGMLKVDVLKVSVLGDPDWGMIGETASDPDNMAGYHDTPQLFLVDEASAKRLDPMFPVIEGTLTTPGSSLVIIGNPTRSMGEFYDSHNRAITMSLYYRIHVSPEMSTKVDKKWVETMRLKYGEDSPIFKVRVLGIFVDMEENQLISLSWLESAREADWKPDGSTPFKRVSVDVADGGVDETVITLAEHYDSFTVMLKQFCYSFPAATAVIDAAEMAIQVFDNNGCSKETDDISVDSIGVGSGTASFIAKKKYPVIRYKGGETEGIDTLMYRNRRVQSALTFRDQLRDLQIIFDEGFLPKQDDWDEFCVQMMSVRTEPKDEKREDLMTKAKMKSEGIKSPDKAESCFMQYANKAPVISFSTTDMITVGKMDSAQSDWS